MVRGAALVVSGLICALMPAARADDDYLARLAGAVRTQLDDAAAAHTTKLVPPVPVAVHWGAQRLGSLDLGAPFVALAAADLDGDGKAELYVVTAREVIAVAVAGKGLRELGRVAFTGDPAVPGSRDVVGTAVVDGNAVIAASSAWARDLRVEWRGKTLIGRHGGPGFRVCGDRMQLAAGRNHFRQGAAAMYGARCRDDLSDPAGYPLRVRGELSATGTLEVSVARCSAEAADCRPAASYAIKDVGFAFEIADVDRDGTLEVIAASASPSGDDDTVRVVPLPAGPAGAQTGRTPTGKPVFKKLFHGGVAGIAVGDGDGNGTIDVFAVVRLPSSRRVDVWRLD